MTWKKTNRTVGADGCVTIRYEAEGAPMVIESRQEHIPHVARSGWWLYTGYHLILPDGTWYDEYSTLGRAKEMAEQLARKENNQ